MTLKLQMPGPRCGHPGSGDPADDRENGLHAPALSFGDPRVMALLAVLLLWRHLLTGFRNRQLVSLMTKALRVSTRPR